MRRLLFASILVIQMIFADQVTLKNSDRLSGNILKYDGKNLVLKSDLAGEVTIPWENVTAITSSQPLNITLKDGQRIVGTVTTDDGKFTVKTQETGTVSAARDSVQYIRNKDEQTAYDTEIERYTNPRIIDLWTGTMDLGYAVTAGNSEAQTFTLGASAVRATKRDKITVTYNQIFANSNSNGPTATTANAKRGSIAYELNVSPRWFVFGAVSLENDQFQDLDLRFAPAGGFGYHVIKNDNTIFDVFGGASLNREFFTTFNRTSGEIVIGEELTHKFSKTTSLHERFAYYPNFSDFGNRRINFDLQAVTAIRKWFSWQITASDRYLSDPVPGKKTNDILFTTGLHFVFAK